MTEQYDIVIIGAGPGGIAAAVTAAKSSKKVAIIDDNRSPGGQIWRGNQPDNNTAKEWYVKFELAHLKEYYEYSVIAFLSPDRILIAGDDQTIEIKFNKLILATGARERFLPFPGWTLPGVTGVGGLQTLVKDGLNIANKKIVIAGTGPLLWAVTDYLLLKQANIIKLIEQVSFNSLARFTFRLLTNHSKLIEAIALKLRIKNIPIKYSTIVNSANGSDKLKSVTLSDGSTIHCDYLAIGYHLVPNLELPLLIGCTCENGIVKTDLSMQTSVTNIFAIGELTGVGGLEKAITGGIIAARNATGQNKNLDTLLKKHKKQLSFTRNLENTFKPTGRIKKLITDDTIVCRCEDITYRQLKPFSSNREAKLHTRCGMGACQGRICSTATSFLFNWNDNSIRPPLVNIEARHLMDKN